MALGYNERNWPKEYSSGKLRSKCLDRILNVIIVKKKFQLINSHTLEQEIKDGSLKKMELFIVLIILPAGFLNGD